MVASSTRSLNYTLIESQLLSCWILSNGRVHPILDLQAAINRIPVLLVSALQYQSHQAPNQTKIATHIQDRLHIQD